MPRAKVYPAGLEPRGKRLWREVTEAWPSLGPGQRVLLEEACRIADRLERLNEQIRGGAVATVETEDGREFTLVVNGAMGEARLATTALRGVMISLGLDAKAQAVPAAPPAAPPEQRAEPAAGDDEAKGADPIDIIRARQRRKAAGEAGA